MMIFQENHQFMTSIAPCGGVYRGVQGSKKWPSDPPNSRFWTILDLERFFDKSKNGPKSRPSPGTPPGETEKTAIPSGNPNTKFGVRTESPPASMLYWRGGVRGSLDPPQGAINHDFDPRTLQIHDSIENGKKRAIIWWKSQFRP